jgi:geranylgeranyl pyrophosphate synthase
MSRQAIDKELFLLAEPLSEPLQSPVLYALRGGKRARGLLLLAAAGNSQPRLVRAAACVELLHAATLVQDDIFDRSAMRRGAPSVYCVYGKQLATLASDWMLAEAMRSAYGLAPAFGDALSRSAQSLIEGEALELAPPGMQTAAELRAHAERVACSKTGELFGLALSTAATLAGDHHRAHVLHQAGCNLGVAFQYMDDVLDLYGDPASADKSLGRDLAGSLCTLPVLDAAAKLPASQATALLSRMGELPASVLQALRARSVQEHVMACARTRWQTALEEIASLFSADSQVKPLLGALAAAMRPSYAGSRISTAA